MSRDKSLKSLFWKVYLLSAALILVTTVSITFVFRNMQKKFILSRLEIEFKTETYFLYQMLCSAQKPFLVEELRIKGSPRVTVMNENGEVLLETMYNPFMMENQISTPEVKKAVMEGWGTSLRWDPYVHTKMFFGAGLFKDKDSPGMIIRLSIPMYEVNKWTNMNLSSIITACGFIFIFLAAITYLLVKKITAPLTYIAERVREFFDGTSSEFIPSFKCRDLNLFSSELNRMFQTIIKKEEELTSVREQMMKVLSSIHDGIILVDFNGIIKRVNHTAEEIIGQGEQGLSGMNINVLMRSDELKKSIEEAKNGMEKVSGITRVLLPEERNLEFTCIPFGDHSGIGLVLHDITRVSKLEKIRRDFVANVSHELKTPATSIKGFLETIMGMGDGEIATRNKFLEIIYKNVLRMENIIDDLLTLSRIESGVDSLAEKPVNVNACVVNALSLIKAKYPQRIVKVMGNEFDYFIRGDSNLLEMALVNLLDNAIKYSSDEIEVILDGDYRKVYISIKDRGIGIPGMDIPRIFERFYRVDKARSRALGGTGLGLTIVKHIADAHKGKIHIRSTVNRGSVFKLEFYRFIDY